MALALNPQYGAAEIPSRRVRVGGFASSNSDIGQIPAPPHAFPSPLADLGQQRPTIQFSGVQSNRATAPYSMNNNPYPPAGVCRQRGRRLEIAGVQVGEGSVNVPPNSSSVRIRPEWQPSARPSGDPNRPQTCNQNMQTAGHDATRPFNRPLSNGDASMRWHNSNQSAGRSIGMQQPNNGMLPTSPATSQHAPQVNQSQPPLYPAPLNPISTTSYNGIRVGRTARTPAAGQIAVHAATASAVPRVGQFQSPASSHHVHHEQTVRLPMSWDAILHAAASKRATIQQRAMAQAAAGEAGSRSQEPVQDVARVSQLQSHPPLHTHSPPNPIPTTAYDGRQTEQTVRLPMSWDAILHAAAGKRAAIQRRSTALQATIREVEARQLEQESGRDAARISQFRSQYPLYSTPSSEPAPASSRRVSQAEQATVTPARNQPTVPSTNSIPSSSSGRLLPGETTAMSPNVTNKPSVSSNNRSNSEGGGGNTRQTPGKSNLQRPATRTRKRRKPQPRRSASSPCSICLDIPEQFPQHRPTSHCTHASTTCAPCLEQHISHAVQSQGSTMLTCPDSECRQMMEYADVVRGARNNRACLDRYEALLLRRTLEKEPNFRWCKSSTCNWGQVHEGGTAAPIVICQACRARSCFTHDIPWHIGLTCEQYAAQRANTRAAEDQASQEYIGKHAKTCPNPSCGRRIEKSQGCDHMTCRRPAGCGHEFCWLCLADYDLIRRDGNHRHASSCRYYAAIEASPPRPAPTAPAPTQSWWDWLFG